MHNFGSKNSNGKAMARYGISSDLGGSVSPVILDVEFFNIEITYQTGIFIITDPGYYRFTVQCYNKELNDQFARVKVEVDSRDAISTFCKYATAGSASGIFYLKSFDTVFLNKSGERLNGGAHWNNFMIEKV